MAAELVPAVAKAATGSPENASPPPQHPRLDHRGSGRHGTRTCPAVLFSVVLVQVKLESSRRDADLVAV
jgi:hypothetical protein